MPLAKGFVAPASRRGEEKAHVEEACPASQQLLHGCQMSRLLQDHHRVQSRPDCCCLRWLLHCPLPAHRGQSQADRGLQLQKEAALKCHSKEWSEKMKIGESLIIFTQTGGQLCLP